MCIKTAETCAFVAKCALEEKHTNTLNRSKMCWNAVVDLAKISKVIDESRYKKICAHLPFSLIHRANSKQVVDIKSVKPGHILGFFEYDPGSNFCRDEAGWVIVHAMVSLGEGWASGHKNGCIGIGSPVGWKRIDLRKLDWVTGAGHFCQEENNRELHVFHKEITDLRDKDVWM